MVQELKKVELVIIIDAACNTCNYTIYCANRNLYVDFCMERARERKQTVEICPHQTITWKLLVLNWKTLETSRQNGIRQQLSRLNYHIERIYCEQLLLLPQTKKRNIF